MTSSLLTDLDLSVTVSRHNLGLDLLQINDQVVYRCAATPFLGESMSWTRNQLTSAYIDGAVTVNRARQMVNEQVAVEVSGRNAAMPKRAPTQLQAQLNMAVLIEAFTQDSFVLELLLGDGTGAARYSYQCEAADVQVAWASPRAIAMQNQVVFTVPRQPVPISGGV